MNNPPKFQTMVDMLAQESYTELCDLVESLNQSELLFTPEHHIDATPISLGVLYYTLSGNVTSGNSSAPAGGTYIAGFTLTDSIESVAQQIAAQCRECEAQGLRDIQDGREMRETELSLDWLLNHGR